MGDAKQKTAVQEFVKKWTGTGQEDENDRSYWIDILERVLGIENATDHIEFQKKVVINGGTKRIDAYIPETKVLIEQKSLDHDLDKKGPQSDGEQLTPFEQANRYNGQLTFDERARWIVTSNFSEIWIYDMNEQKPEPVKLLLSELEDNFDKLDFLVNQETKKISREIKISKDAGELVGKLYDAFLKQYPDPESKESLHDLNVLCVRLVFCLYAENSGLFGHNGMFREYMESFETERMRWALEELFKVLDTPEDERPRHLADDNPKAVSFPYVNGGLFSEKNIDIQPFTEEIRELLLDEASAGFNWSDISPTIFGAVFESTLNPETRRSGGMHYTSIENIHKVINPLFLDDLEEEFAEIRAITVERTRNKKLDEFQTKLSTLTFLDPACGSGNFLTESYLSLRRLENDVLRERLHGQMSFGFEEANPIRVTLSQFYGIEINDFAVSVAMTALWIAESQMMQETENIVSTHLEFLPLKSFTNIVEGNALRIDWSEVVPRLKLNYIMGNPPFVGSSLQTKEQKNDILSTYIDETGKSYKTAGKVDYVSGWYFKASEFINGTSIHVAFVSTNSITQGEQVVAVWEPLYSRFKIHIDFAYLTFRWDSEANLKAHVHCVIIGFSCASNLSPRRLYEENSCKEVKNINAYLMPADDIFIGSRRVAICDVPEICSGFKPADNGFLILNEEEKAKLLRLEPDAERWIRPYSMGVEFINKIPRYCLWLVDIKPNDLRQLPEIKKRVSACKEWREAATKTGDAYKLKDVPHLFRPCKQFKDDLYIAVPLVSSSQRRYIPMGFIDNGMIPGNNLFCIFDATPYHFGVLTSNVHMAWIRAIGGRLKSDWRYSKDIVYNNFPWPAPTDEQRVRIEQTAQAILDARALYPDSSLADLYDVLTMPPELRKAHQENDMAVMAAYGFTKGTEEYTSEAACVAALMKMYQELVDEK